MSTALGIQAVSGRELLVFVGRIAEDRHLGVAVRRTAIAAAGLAVAPRGLGSVQRRRGLNCIQMASSSSCRISPAISKQTLQAVAEQAASRAGESGQAARSASGRTDGRRAQQVEQVHRLWRPGSGISGRVAKYSGNCCVTWR